MWTSSVASTACSRIQPRVTLPVGRHPAGLALSVPRLFWALPFCIALLFATAALADHSLAATEICLSAGEPVQIRRVIDGDTVVLDSGERVRLIGIDTPELARNGRPAEHGAETAKTALEILLQQATQITARIGAEPRDRYGRLLAHLYADGRNMQALLLEDGLAVPMIFPPNVHHVDCYEQATRAARAAQRGLWTHPDYRVWHVDELESGARSYHVVRGPVERIGHSRGAVWINLAQDFALRIPRDHLEHFDGFDFDALIGTELEARGVIYRRNEQLRMNIRHPGEITIEIK